MCVVCVAYDAKLPAPTSGSLGWTNAARLVAAAPRTWKSTINLGCLPGDICMFLPHVGRLPAKSRYVKDATARRREAANSRPWRHFPIGMDAEGREAPPPHQHRTTPHHTTPPVTPRQTYPTVTRCAAAGGDPGDWIRLRRSKWLVRRRPIPATARPDPIALR